MSQESPSREEQIAEVAARFADFIETQTGEGVPEPASIAPDGLEDALSALDAALNQLADLADAYGTDRLQAVEPLVLPIAALAGEYLIHGADASWVEPIIDADSTLIIALPGGVAVDLTGAVRASLMSGMSNLRVMVARLLDPEGAP